MTEYFVAVVLGIALLVWGADRFVLGAAATARNLGVSPLVVGLTVVGVGTSAPEILVSTMAALQDTPGLAIGNALGSNITNVGLVLGVTALVSPLDVHSRILRREFPLMFLVMFFAWALLLDGTLSRIDGLLLLAGLVGVVGWLVRSARGARRPDALSREFTESIPGEMATGRALTWAVAGLLVLLAGSRTVVWGATGIARALDVSDLLIGLTIVAVGTSLPELAASLASVLRREPDIAIGNVIGSNMFNLLPVLGVPGIIAPATVAPDVLRRDFPVMVGLSLVLLAFAYGFRGHGRISRWEGGLLLLAFCAYQSFLYMSAL